MNCIKELKHILFQFILSTNQNALGYFAHPDLVLKSTDHDNFKKQINKLSEIFGDIKQLKKKLMETEEENSIADKNGNLRPKKGLEPVLGFNNDCNTELAKLESKLLELESKISPIKAKYDKDFVLSTPKIRDSPRAAKENKRKANKRKRMVEIEEDAGRNEVNSKMAREIILEIVRNMESSNERKARLRNLINTGFQTFAFTPNNND